MKKEDKDKDYYFLKSIERNGDNSFSISVSSAKGDTLNFVLIKELVPAENNEFISIYKCRKDEDSVILSRMVYDIRALLKAVAAFHDASHL